MNGLFVLYFLNMSNA